MKYLFVLVDWKERLNANKVEMIALFMIGVLGLAAYGKYFHPVELLQAWERSIAVFELVLIVCIWTFRKHVPLWIGTALLFASWAGYASFWYAMKLPCSCMGSLLAMPAPYTIGIDLLFICASLYLVKSKTGSLRIRPIFLGLSLSALSGSFVGYQIYVGWVAGVAGL